MKLCYDCGSPLCEAERACSACGYTPLDDGRIALFDPAFRADENFSAALHEEIDALQEGSFWFRARNRLISSLLSKYCPLATNLIEVGCGTGFVLKAVSKLYPAAHVAGSELFPNALHRAANRLPGRVELMQFDARKMPFENEFDVVCAFDVLEHIEEDEDVLRRFQKAMLPGGTAVLSVPQHPSLWSRNDELWFHKRRYKIGELEEKCRQAGLNVVFSSSFVASLLPLMAAQRLWNKRTRRQDGYEELRISALTNKILEPLLSTEARLISMGFSMPVGGSRFVVARK